MTDAAALGAFAALLGASVALGEGLRWAGWRPESSRRLVHLAVGLSTAACPLWLSSPAGVYVLALLFVAANGIAVPRRWLPGMHAITRRSWGTVTFPLALLLALVLCWTLDPGRVFALQVAFAVLALADPAASFVGTRVASPRFAAGGETKSVAGSLAFVAVASATAGAGLAWLAPASWGVLPIVAGTATVAALGAVAEALGRRGWDNLWIVLAAIVPLAGLEADPSDALLYLLALGTAAAFGVASYRVRFLDLSGALAASLLAWMVVAVGGVAWALPAVTFFLLSSLLSRAGRRRKRDAEARAAKGSRRDVGQVMANGGIGMLLLALWPFVPSPVLYGGFLGSFAAAAADTWGTEIGTLVRGPTRHLGIGRRVPPGTSGGVSLVGTLGAALGAAVVVAVAAPFADLGRGTLGLIVGAGLVGAFVDTVLGATVQARFWAPDGTLTERDASGGRPHPLAAGVRAIDNDVVNLVCTASGAALAALVVGMLG